MNVEKIFLLSIKWYIFILFHTAISIKLKTAHKLMIYQNIWSATHSAKKYRSTEKILKVVAVLFKQFFKKYIKSKT